MEDNIQPTISEEIKRVTEGRPKFSWLVLLIASFGSGILIFSLISDFTLNQVSNNVGVIIKFALSIFIGGIIELVRHNYAISRYLNKADGLLKRILPQIVSQEFRRSLAVKTKSLDRNSSAAIKIERTEMYEGRIVVLIKRAINLRLGSVLILEDEIGELVAEFTVDNENADFWSARSTENIDGLWLVPLSSQTNIWLGDYYRLYEVI